MHFLDDALLPENQPPLVIQVAPYAPSFLPSDSDDIPVSMADQVQKAVDCYNAGATVLHVHVREPNGSGSKNLDMFNEMLDRLRTAVPGMILQVGGSISFAPRNPGEAAQWLSDDTRHMLAELSPKPDQVTLVVNTNQMNVMGPQRRTGHLGAAGREDGEDFAGTLAPGGQRRRGAAHLPHRRVLHQRGETLSKNGWLPNR